MVESMKTARLTSSDGMGLHESALCLNQPLYDARAGLLKPPPSAGRLFLAFEAAAFAAGFCHRPPYERGACRRIFFARFLVAEFALAAVAAFAAPAFAFGLGCAAFAAFAGGLHAFRWPFQAACGLM